MFKRRKLSETTKRLLDMDVEDIASEMQHMTSAEIDQVCQEVTQPSWWERTKVRFFRFYYKTIWSAPWFKKHKKYNHSGLAYWLVKDRNGNFVGIHYEE